MSNKEQGPYPFSRNRPPPSIETTLLISHLVGFCFFLHVPLASHQQRVEALESALDSLAETGSTAEGLSKEQLEITREVKALYGMFVYA